MVTCAIFSCSNSQVKVDGGQKIRFYRFPRNPEMCRRWVIACQRSDAFNPNKAKICSVHFKPTDRARNLKHELLGYCPQNARWLKEDAVPTLHLTHNRTPVESDAVSYGNAEDVRRRSKKRHVSDHQSSQEVSKEKKKTTKAARKELGNATKKPDKWGLNVLIEWLEANALPKQFESLSKEELDKLLSRLYLEVQNKKGEKLSKAAFISIRDAIQKHLENRPWNIDYVIKTDPAFSHSNTILEDLEPQDCPLKSCDVEQLVKTGTLGMHNPTALQNLVWISMALHLGELNIVQWTKMTKSSFVRSTDERGMDYIGWSGCAKSMSDDSSASFSARPHLKIYALPQDPLCPIKAFDLYMSLLNPAIDELWQKPNASYKKTNRWYLKQSAGKRAIEDMMKNMCLLAKLNKQHSNSCVSITSSTILMEADIQESDIKSSGNQRNTRPRRQKLPREKEGLNWQEQSQTHCYEDLVTVNNISSSDIVVKCEDIKIEDEDPLAVPATEDVVPLKRRRIDCDGDVDDILKEEYSDQFAEDDVDDPSYQQMTINPLEDAERETTSPASVAEDESFEMDQTENVATPPYIQPFIEAQKKDIYDDFAGQIAKTLRDLNDLNTFRRVQIEINNILLDALSGKYKDLEYLEKQPSGVLSISTQTPKIPSTNVNNAQTNSSLVQSITNPSQVTLNHVTSECLLQNSVNTLQTVQSTMNKGQIFVNTLTPRPVILTPNSLKSGSIILNPVNSMPVNQTPNLVTSGPVLQNPNPITSELANQNPVMSVSVSQDSNPLSSESVFQHSNPVMQNPNPVTSCQDIQNPNPVTSGQDIQNSNPVTSGPVLQNINLATSGPIIQNQNTTIKKSINLGQLVNNPMNLWQLIKNPHMPEQVMLRPINLRQMSQIVGSMKQTASQSATAVTTSSTQKQVTSTLTLTPVSRSSIDT